MLSVIAVNVWRGFPFTTIVILAGLTAIPDEVETINVPADDRFQIITEHATIFVSGLRVPPTYRPLVQAVHQADRVKREIGAPSPDLLQDPVLLHFAEGVSRKLLDDADLAWALVVGERPRADGGELGEQRFG